MKKLFRVSNHITLKLDEGRTQIYLDREKFIQCKYILIEKSKFKNNDNDLPSIDKYSYNIKNVNGYFSTDSLYHDFEKLR
ncbi:MAG: hypothetical protein ACFFD7_03350 [Candidatus Thorarchaeota archaeon]